MARVLLIRHCQSTGQGFEALAAWLVGRGVDRIVSSPFERAIDTVLPFAKHSGFEVEVDERLAERRLGQWFDSIAEHLSGVRFVMGDREKRYGDGESGVEVTARGWPAVLEALDGPNGLTALVSHGQLSSHLLREIDGSSGYDLWIAMTTPDVFEIWRDATGLHFERVWTEASARDV